MSGLLSYWLQLFLDIGGIIGYEQDCVPCRSFYDFYRFRVYVSFYVPSNKFINNWIKSLLLIQI